MPPHCDSLDGPVVTAARQALDAAEVALILPYVHADGEAEVREAFHRALKVRALGSDAREVADRWFFETVVRVHRAGEGAAFTGLKPAGLDVGPAIPEAEHALATGIDNGLIELLCTTITSQVRHRHAHAMALQAHSAESIAAARAYVDAALGFQVWVQSVYRRSVADSHDHVG